MVNAWWFRTVLLKNQNRLSDMACRHTFTHELPDAASLQLFSFVQSEILRNMNVDSRRDIFLIYVHLFSMHYQIHWNLFIDPYTVYIVIICYSWLCIQHISGLVIIQPGHSRCTWWVRAAKCRNLAPSKCPVVFYNIHIFEWWSVLNYYFINHNAISKNSLRPESRMLRQKYQKWNGDHNWTRSAWQDHLCNLRLEEPLWFSPDRRMAVRLAVWKVDQMAWYRAFTLLSLDQIFSIVSATKKIMKGKNCTCNALALAENHLIKTSFLVCRLPFEHCCHSRHCHIMFIYVYCQAHGEQ